MSDESSQAPKYSPQTDAAFPSDKKKTQHTVYALPDTWDDVDGNGLLFETEVRLRRDGYDSIQKRELYNALFQAAVEELSREDIAQQLIQTRERRTDGSLL